MSYHLTQDSIEATVRGIAFRRAVIGAANEQMNLHEPQWDLIDHKVNYQSEDVRTGKRKVAVTLIFEDNGLALR
jgi:hypothetical protein